MTLRFWKLSGAGNDFVLVRRASLRGRSPRTLAKTLCDRKRGIGADGLLVVSSGRAPRLDYYNADGSEAFCGNGTRCAASWLMKRRKNASIRLKTSAGILAARSISKGRVSVSMPTPGPIRVKWVNTSSREYKAYLINTGVPHAVVFVPDTQTVSVESVGRVLRRKLGANINFVATRGQRLAIRTYERGVETETLACGSGAVAAAAVACALRRARPPVEIQTPGGLLKVDFSSGVTLEGPAEIVFTGEIR